LINKELAGIMLFAFIVAWAGVVQAITCEECKEMERNRASLESQITQKDNALKAAFDKKQFQEVTEIRRQVLELRRSLIELQKKDVGCKDACRPDAMKDSECSRLRSEIIKLEDDPASPVDKVDALYRNLANCNKDLADIKKPR
jgi:predicted RNase H-like nuclease (RuvC/YqgF family)